MRNLDEVRTLIEEARARKERINQQMMELARSCPPGDSLPAGYQERADRLETGLTNADREIGELTQEMREIVRSLATNPGNRESGDGAGSVAPVATRVRRDSDSPEISRALKVLDTEGRHLPAAAGDQVDRLLRAERTDEYDPRETARLIEITEHPSYKSAFQEVMRSWMQGVPPLLEPQEVFYMRAARRYHAEVARAMGENTSTAGGVAVPAFIDPSLIITSGAIDAPILQVARIEHVTTNIWKGVSTAGMSWSYDTEAAEVSSDEPTDLTQPSVTVHMARGFLPYSIEVGQDWAGFAAEMGGLLAEGYTDLIARRSATGTGSGEPFGIFTALDANTNVEVVVTTDGSFGGQDVLKVWNALPERYRRRATWVMSESVRSAIRSFSQTASGVASSWFTVDLTGGEFRINERSVVITDYAPTFSSGVPGTTGAANILCVGDFRNYAFAQRAGMTVENVQHLFGASQRPTGQRGLFAWARHGMDSVADNGFRLLQNQ